MRRRVSRGDSSRLAPRCLLEVARQSLSRLSLPGGAEGVSDEITRREGSRAHCAVSSFCFKECRGVRQVGVLRSFCCGTGVFVIERAAAVAAEAVSIANWRRTGEVRPEEEGWPTPLLGSAQSDTGAKRPQRAEGAPARSAAAARWRKRAEAVPEGGSLSRIRLSRSLGRKPLRTF